MIQLRPQQRIATLVGVTVIVLDEIAQLEIAGAVDAAAIVQLPVPLVLLPGDGGIGEPVVVGATGFFFTDA